MKKHWHDIINKIDNLEDRRLLRDVLLGAFSNIEDYTNEQLNNIKKRVFEESKFTEQDFNIYTSLVTKDTYDPINDFLFPMEPEDLNGIDLEELLKFRDESEENLILGKFYLDLDYLELKEIHQKLEKRKFSGKIVTNKSTYDINITLAPHEGYKAQVEKLYMLHIENKMPWKTVLNPGIYKFIEIRLASHVELEKQEKIQEITFDLEEFDSHQLAVYIPLWNVGNVPLTNQGFPQPAINRVHYEHEITFKESARKNGYLFDSDNTLNGVIDVRLYENGVLLTSQKDDITNWKLWHILHPLPQDLENQNVMTNAKKESFINHYAMGGRTVRSTGEIYRIANAYIGSSKLKLVNVEIVNHINENIDTYAVNYFLKDDIRKDKDKKIMLLTFAIENMNNFTRDEMSFITSEINLQFPEYECVGKLI